MVPAIDLNWKNRLAHIDTIAADFTQDANHVVVAPIFREKFGRSPLPPHHPDALINDLIFARMIDLGWSPLKRAMVDKVTAKAEVARAGLDLRIPSTLATIAMDEVASPAELFALLHDFLGTDAIAKPAQASGGTVFLRNVSGPADLADLHALATSDYALVMREMQYAGLPQRVIVEATIPTEDGRPPDDFKFHCVHGEPLACQIDHARFGQPWSQMLRLPDFEPLDPADGLIAPPGLRLPLPERLAAMTAAARALSAPFEYVRVDLYDGLDGVYFGELTFTPSASLGIAPSENGSHRVSETHRRFSRTLMRALRSPNR